MDYTTDNPGKLKSLKELDGLPIFFIVGRGRSGSTLLRSILDAHPGIMIPLESRFVQFLYYSFPVNKPWTLEEAFQAVEALESGFEPLNLHRESLLNELEQHKSGLTLDRVCKLIYLHTRSEFRKNRIRILGDKNPRYAFFIPQLLELFPGARFIHLVRDYRDNIVSVQRAAKHIKESGNPYFAMGRWRLYNRQVLNYQKRYPDRFHRVYFEELIRNPEAVMKKLCNFLEVDFHPDMLNYEDGLGSYFEKKDFSDLHQSLQTPFNPSKIGEWERKLPVGTAIRCEVLGGNLAKDLGYPSHFIVPLAERAAIKILYFPLVLLGQFRFLIKSLFYRSRFLMRVAYGILLKLK